MRPFLPFIVAAMALALAACGNDEPDDHGMSVEDQPDTPMGDEIVVTYAFDEGERWTGEFTLRAVQEKQEGRREPLRKADAVSTLAFEQAYLGGDPPSSETRMRYVAIRTADGRAVETPEGETVGRFLHQENGRPDPTSLRLGGQLVAENQTLYRSLLLAGLGGTDAWLPDRPVRVGASWPVRDAVNPQLIRVWSTMALQPDTALPEPRIQGTVRVERVEDGAHGKVLVLRIDCLFEMEGPVTSGRHRAQLSIGYHVQGTAHVDVRTGVPTRLETTGKMDLSQVGGGDEMVWRLDLELTGTTERESS